MIRKNLHFVLMIAAMAVSSMASAQLYIDNAQFFIQSGAVVTVQGDVTSNADIQGPGKLQLKGSANQNVSMSGKTIPFLEIDNVANATLTSNAIVSDSILFTNGNILLGSNNLALGASPAGKIVSATNTKFVVTNGTGKLVKAALGAAAFTYPVGNSTTTYNPVAVANSGTADSIGVRCLANALSLGTSGTAFTKEAVDASWDLSESVAGGSNLSVTANWATTDQLPNFNNAKCGISNYITTPANNVGWDLLNTGLTAAAAGTPNYSVTRTGITNLGTFAVGFRPVLSPLLTNTKIYLQGPTYTAGTMAKTLATSHLIPVTEPYTGMFGITHTGSGGGETVGAPGETAATTSFFINNNIVDWVYVQLYNSGGTVVSSRSALLKSDGSIVEPDVAGTGVVPLSLGGNLPGNYFISVKHRNHLGAKSAAVIDYSLAKTTVKAYDFTTGLTQAFAGVVTNPQMATIASGVYGLWAGNTLAGTAGSEKNVRASGPASVNDAISIIGVSGSTGVLSGVYNSADMNLDGNVRSSGPAGVNDFIKELGIAGSSIITQPY